MHSLISITGHAVFCDVRSIYDFTAMKDDDAVLVIKNNAWTSTDVLMFPDDQPVSYFKQLKLRYDTRQSGRALRRLPGFGNVW